jgi:aryl-alcohol dehydrogenase-like predicted oxidoreductase
MPEGSRAAVDKATGGQGNLGGRKTDRGVAAAEAYGRLAAEHGWDVVHMVIAWQLTRPFKVVPIIGATTMDQLRHLIAGLDRDLPDELRRGIERLHRAHPLPY